MVRPTAPHSNIIPDFWTAGTCQRMATVRILLVDDFAPFRTYVRRLLEGHPEWEVIGEAGDGLDALQMAAEMQPDLCLIGRDLLGVSSHLILLDISLPRLNGIDVAQQIGAIVQRSKILFLSSHCSQELARAAMATGAMAYVVKWDADRDLLRAIITVMEGKWFVSNRLSGYELPDPT